MRRAGLCTVARTTVAVGSALVDQALMSPSPASSLPHNYSGMSAQCRLRHSSGLFACGRIVRFDLRKHEMEKRRLRELEKAGINPTDDEDAPWIAPEEQQRLDEAEEQRRAEMEEQRQGLMKKRAEEDAVRRRKFKEFRAKQIAMSRHRKETMAEKKEETRQHRQQTSRINFVEEVRAAEDDASVGVSSAPVKATSHSGMQ
ncbi:hypothetical protein Q4I28_008251 [Leishmania naiffi]|uniref:Uncharacterized protein n=1 Tax=Leishmania naiffi TaxID=5678 RepID=A0AAW3B592_9TRYP